MISVIIPIFNDEEYIPFCINSVLNQSYQDFEIICVDNGSTDASLEILEYFKKKDSRVKIIKNEKNQCWGFSKNKALDISRGKYIFFLDVNGWLSSNTFEILIKKVENENIDLIMFKHLMLSLDSLNFSSDKYLNIEFMNSFDSKVFTHNDLDKTKLFRVFSNLSNNLYSKSFLDEFNIRFPNEKLVHEDMLFFYKCLISARKISFINEYLYNLHENKEFSSDSTKERLFNDIGTMYLILKLFLENKKIYEYYKKEILTFIFSTLYHDYYQIEDIFKEKFFNNVQRVFKNFIQNFGLYVDIKDNINKDILLFFNFEEIVVDLLKATPKISVIVPVYNVEKYLKQCLDSICNQSFKDIEIICVDDGSNDSSQKILYFYAEKDNRIKIITQENKGPGHARNVGFNHATGEYILFVDSDDFLCENTLKKLYVNAVLNDSDLVVFKFFIYDENKDTFIPRGLLLNELFGDIDYNNFTFTYRDIKEYIMDEYFAVWFKLYKKEFLDKYNFSFPVKTVFEDVLFQVKSFIYANKISFLPENLYSYRSTNPNSITKTISKTWAIVDVINSVESFLKHSSLYDYFEFEFLKFKIFHLSYRIRLSEGDEYFNFVREELINIKNNPKLNNNVLPPKIKTMLLNVLNSETRDGYMNKL